MAVTTLSREQVRPTRADRVANALGVSPAKHGIDPYLDGVRAVAVLLIFTMHCWGLAGNPPVQVAGIDLRWIPDAMDWGVDLFFMLSGLLLARPWFRAEFGIARPPRLGGYLMRRAARILPAYYLSLIVMLAIFSARGPIRQEGIEGWTGFWQFSALLVGVPRLFPLSSGMLNYADPVWWTLTVEVMWYLILPLVVLAFLGRRWVLAIPGAAMVSIGWVYLANHSLGPLVTMMSKSIGYPTTWDLGVSSAPSAQRGLLLMSLPTYAITFALGVALARLTVIDAVRPLTAEPPWWKHPRVSKGALIGGALLLAAHMYTFGTKRVAAQAYIYDFPWQVLIRATALGLIIFALATGARRFRAPLEVLPLRFIGWISFGLYLFHFPVLHLLHDAGHIHSFLWMYVVGFGVSGVVATFCWYFVERPFLTTGPSMPSRRFVATLLLVSAIASYLWAVRQPDPETAWSPLMAAQHSGASTVPLPLRPMPEMTPNTDLSGPTDLAHAVRNELLFPAAAEILTTCGAQAGSAVVGGSPAWYAVVTSFRCQSAAAAKHAATSMNRTDLEAGFIPDSSRQVATMHLPVKGPSKQYPYVHHARWASGSTVTEIVVSACQRRRTAGKAIDLIIDAATYPPAG